MAALLKKNRPKLGPIARFGLGYPLIKEDDKVIQCQEWVQFRDSMSHDPNRYDIMNPNWEQSECDRVSVDKAGQLIVGGRKYMMYETAFYQLLSALQIPLSFAMRVPPTALTDLINSMLERQFIRSCYIKTYDGVGAVAFTFKSDERPIALSVYRLFENLNQKRTKSECKVDFLFCLTQGFKSIMALQFSEYRGQPVMGAVEILASDSMEFRPFVSGMVIAPKSHMLIKSLCLPIETNDATKAMSMSETFITRIGGDIGSWIKRYNNLEKVTVTEEMASVIQSRAKKSLKQKFEVKAGETLAKVYESLIPLRKNQKNTILEKRSIAFFAGFLASLAQPE